MKKLLILLSLGYSATSLYAYHMDLQPSTKCTFARKRLKMMQAHLQATKEELVLLEGSLSTMPDYEIEHFPLRQTRISELKKEVKELESSIPIMEKSLQALCKTL